MFLVCVWLDRVVIKYWFLFDLCIKILFFEVMFLSREVVMSLLIIFIRLELFDRVGGIDIVVMGVILIEFDSVSVIIDFLVIVCLFRLINKKFLIIILMVVRLEVLIFIY